jgi:hypothetical protein
MQMNLSFKSHNILNLANLALNGSFIDLLRRALATVFLAGFICLSGLPTGLALATHDLSGVVAVPVQPERFKALVSCLPKQLSQPDRERTLGEMGNDQLERVLNLKSNPKLSQAETELATCMSRQGFSPLS